MAFGFFLLAAGAGLAYGILIADETHAATKLILLALAALMGALSWLAADVGVTRVTIHDDGLEVRRLFRVKRIAWSRIARIDVAATRRARLRDVAGDCFGPAGTLTVIVADALLDERAEDPFRERRVRGRYDPRAVLLDARGRRLTGFGVPLWWDFFDALFVEAAARGVEFSRSA